MLARQKLNETAYRQLLVQGALAVLLPTEDLQNAPLRTLVGDIVADLILGQVIAGKVAEGWFMHETVSKIVAVSRPRIESKATGDELRVDSRDRLEKFGLLSSKAEDGDAHSSSAHQSSASVWFWSILQYLYLTYLFGRFVVMGLSEARTLPDRTSRSSHVSLSTITANGQGSRPPSSSNLNNLSLRAVLDYRGAALVTSALDLSSRMPWLQSTFSYWQHFLTLGMGHLASANSLFDK